MLRAACCALCFIVTAGSALATPSFGDLTGPWILVVDDHPIAAREQVARTYHAFEKHPDNPVLIGDKPWEHELVYLYGTVLPGENGQGYRMWYHGLPMGNEPDYSRLMYATSDDGLQWHKPNLGIINWFGSTNNNIFINRTGRDHIPSIIHTPWAPNPNRRYRMINWDSYYHQYLAAYSPDGIHWTDSTANPLSPIQAGGDVGQFVWDPHTERYLGYVKLSPYVRGVRRRSVAFTTSTDFENWSTPTLILAPDDVDDRWISQGGQSTHFYGMSAFAYESMYIGFLWVFRMTGVGSIGDDGPIFVELVTSHDGVNWYRQEGDRPPILDLAPFGEWDGGMIFTPNHPLVEGDTIRLYYGACDGYHGGPAEDWKAAIGLATLRKDGFASLDAGATPGTITTKRLANAQGPLRVNADAAGGWLTVEVLDEQGQVIPGYASHECHPFEADAVDATVTWQNHAELPSGYPALRLRFILQDASLYSFMAGDDVSLIDEPAGVPMESLYTFEGYTGTLAPDQLVFDGSQKMTFHGVASVETDPAHARFGQQAARLSDPQGSHGWLELSDTKDLSTQFTLATYVKIETQYPVRLFSTYDGEGGIGTSNLAFTLATVHNSPGQRILRLTCKGIDVNSPPVSFSQGVYQHVAATYDEGLVKLYLNGNQVGQGPVGGGAPVQLVRNLQMGRDADPTHWQQLIGWVDDVLVLQRALSSQEVADLAQNGAEAFFGIGTVPGDLNGDGIVDAIDCMMLRDAMPSTLGDPDFIPVADQGHDGRLSCDDADAWMADYRAFVGDPNAPDPCGLMDPTDSDGDGVRDLCDFCPGTIPGVPVNEYGCPLIGIPGDMDSDGDVDMEDFGLFQVCLSGRSVPQTDPGCAGARLRGNDYVDRMDTLLFLGCMSGPMLAGDPDCLD